MIDIHFTILAIGTDPQNFQADMPAVPRIHEMVQVGGQFYRVEDITHNIEAREVHVRAVR